MSQLVLDSVAGLQNALASFSHSVDGVIAIDGALGAGKTTLARQIAPLLGIAHVDLDDYLTKNRGCFVGALDLQRLTQALHGNEGGRAVVSGVCVMEVLHRINRSAAVLVYVKRMSGNRWADRNEIEGDQIEQIAAALGQSASENPIHLEVRAYHREYEPQRHADLIFQWDSRPQQS